MEPKESSHRPDVACARCRERKVRCGRERPACMNCMSDNVDCEYSLPEKRVNHTKLLVRNFDRLEVRLSNIEGELSWLTALLKTWGFQKDVYPNSGSIESADDRVSPVEHEQIEYSSPVSATNRHIVRGHDTLGDQYYGPGTLFSLCYNLKKTVLSNKWTVQRPPGDSTSPMATEEPAILPIGDRRAELLSRICSIASLESLEPILDGPEQVQLRLPPKQLLLMVLPQFFSQVDYSIDVFVESHLRQNIEHVYSRPPTSANDAWAICFNTIILLVLDSEGSTRGNDPLMASQYSLPFFHAMRAALHQAHLLTTPRLINVQALALLSIAAQRYYPCAKEAAIFAQACLLARITGLHQAIAAPADLSPEERQERQKTFISLYLRDKTLSLSWYSICWLPSFDRSLSFNLSPSMFADPRITSRIHLAEIQEQLYCLLSAEMRQTTPQGAREIASISQRLDAWAKRHGTYTLPFLSPLEAELQLTFLATRMLAHSQSAEDGKTRKTLDDARASSLILLASYDKQEPNTIDMLESLHPPTGKMGTPVPSTESNTSRHPSNSYASSTGRLSSLLDAFPVMAFFFLAENILQSVEGDEKSTMQDLKLLHDVHSCFAEVNLGVRSNNRASQVELIFRHVLELIELAKHQNVSITHSPGGGPAAPSSHMGTPPNSGDMPSSGDMSWDFLTGLPGDTMVNIENDEEGGVNRRKRPRTGELDFSLNSLDLGLLFPTDSGLVFSLDDRDRDRDILPYKGNIE